MKKIIDQQDKGELIVPQSLKTGKQEFDNWFSRFGGIVLGSSIYVTGTSGGGKSTLLANLMTWLEDHVSAFYSREMLKRHLLDQVRDLTFSENAYISDVEDNPTFDSFMQDVYKIKPKVIIIDSLQVIAKEDYEMTGLLSEDKACYKIIKELRDYVNANDAILFLIGHNTKDGVFAGANTNMQMIDAHIDIVYDKDTNSRTMSWGQKNRKGPMGTIPFSIKESKIIFDTNEINNFSEENKTEDPFTYLFEKIKSIVYDEETYLSNVPDAEKEKIKKHMKKEMKKNEKMCYSEVDKLSRNIVSLLKINKELQVSRVQ